MIDLLFLQKIIVSLSVGGLIGLERQHTKRQEIIGLRTFALVSLLGVLSVMLSQAAGTPLIAVLGFLLASAFSFALYIYSMSRGGPLGFTTAVSLMLTFILGTLVGLQYFSEAVFLAVIITVILYSRERLRGIAKDITEKEITDFLEFAVLIGVVYPLLPPHTQILGIDIPLLDIWLLVVLVGIINFFAFVAARYVSAVREIELTSFLGGLIASTPTAVALLSFYRENRRAIGVITGGFMLLNAAMLVRNFLIVAVPNPGLAYFMGIPVLVMLASTLGYAYFVMKGQRSKAKLHVVSPFGVVNAAKLGLGILATYIVLGEVQQWLGPGAFLVGVFLASMVSSTGVAATVSTLTLSGGISLAAASVALMVIFSAGFISNLIVYIIGKSTEVIHRASYLLALGFIAALAVLFLVISATL